jgi:putative transposase
MACLFADHDQVEDLSAFGLLVERAWKELPARYATLDLDLFVVMPNHFHGLMFLHEVRESTLSVSAVLQGFKAQTAREINKLRGRPGAAVWQRGFHDRIIRNEAEFGRVRKYIYENPVQWALDREEPEGEWAEQARPLRGI